MHRIDIVSPLFTIRSMLQTAIACVALIAVPPAAAQDATDEAEANASQSDIVVTARRTEDRIIAPQVELSGQALLETQPTNVADSLRGLSGVSIRTNSRGETVARVRGAEERQTAVFLDGAPFNVPWDGRIDLGVLPAGLIGNITVTKGAVPVEFGANAVAGVVDLQTRRGGGADGSDGGFTGLAERGTLGFTNLAGVVSVGNDDFDVTLSGGYVRRDATPLADRDATPFSQGPGNRRTNTDLDSFTVFAAVGNRFGPIETRLSVIHNQTERGIAPESDRNPALFAPRFFRYPSIELTQVTFNAKVELAEKTDLIAVAYGQKFNQQIDSFRDISFRTLRTRQLDDDDTFGGRLTLASKLGPVGVRLSGSYQTSEHEQIDTPFPSAIPGPNLKFEQNLTSVGIEADIPVSDTTRVTLGGGYDRATTPLTGDKPNQPSQDSEVFSASLKQRLGDGLSLTLSGGKRTRFASARELFGEALGRFLINTDLRPETAILADAEVELKRDRFTLRINPYFADGKDTISQRVVRVGNASLRQRFNLSGTKSYGLDGSLQVKITDQLGFALAGNVQDVKADKGSAPIRRLPQRQRYELNAVLDYRLENKFYVAAEIQQTGNARDDAPDGSSVILPSSTEFSLRGAITIFRPSKGPKISLTAAGDNLTNENVVAQLGLPSPGRTIRFGVRFD
jgi:iron complex outermembrane recepter protein